MFSDTFESYLRTGLVNQGEVDQAIKVVTGLSGLKIVDLTREEAMKVYEILYEIAQTRSGY